MRALKIRQDIVWECGYSRFSASWGSFSPSCCEYGKPAPTDTGWKRLRPLLRQSNPCAGKACHVGARKLTGLFSPGRLPTVTKVTWQSETSPTPTDGCGFR